MGEPLYGLDEKGTYSVVGNLPVASVLMPVYNAEAYLAEAVESVLGQTEKNIELVAVDDGSTDSSRAILRRFARQDARVRVFEEEHKGFSPTLNRGIEVARSNYICRLDADDMAMPDRIEKQSKFLDAHPDYVLVGGQVAIIGQAGERIGIAEQPLKDVGTALRSANCLVHSAVMFRKAEVLSAGGYDPLFFPVEDYDLWVRLAARHQLANLPDIVCGYRVHGNQISSSGIFRMIFIAMCVRAAFRGPSRETIKGSVQAVEKDFFPVLRSLGFGNDEIANSVTGDYTFWVTTLKRTGRQKVALKLLSELARHLITLKPDSAHLYQVYSLGILVSLEARSYGQALRYLLLALKASPGRAFRRIFNKLSTLFSTSNRAQLVS